MAADTTNRDLTLAPGSYLYLQSEGKGGAVIVHVGPSVVNQTGQDTPVQYNAEYRRFERCETLEAAVQFCPEAPEGYYVRLENPTRDNKFPDLAVNQTVPLEVGRRINIRGPWSNALWPRQVATVIEGHRLSLREYLVVVIYNSELAANHWETGTVVETTEGAEVDENVSKTSGLPRPESFAVGTRIIIRGTDVSFFIPCDGVDVMPDQQGKYIREAVTLEHLQYTCLVNESGDKEYPRGPAVVFPGPTQSFLPDAQGRRVFRPLELNKINGVHLKTTTDFEDEDLEKPVGPDGIRPMRKYRKGEEVFVTGDTCPILYPRQEMATIEYGKGKPKHYSTAVPLGEGRYLINRLTGAIKLVKGPIMLLPDPRREILVRRVLDVRECALMFPGNDEAAEYNASLRSMMTTVPSGRSGVVSDRDFRQQVRRVRTAKAAPSSQAFEMASLASYTDFEPEEVSDEDAGTAVTRKTTYTKPRELTLNTKYDGAVKIEVWPGFAVLVLGADGGRRVVEGPAPILLEYHETLGHMSLSTGKPKSTDRLLMTGYLCVNNNQVGDIIKFESHDHVRGSIKLSLRVNFEADDDEGRLAWFSVENYVKYLTDHVRSILAGMFKNYDIAEIKHRYIELCRDAILGEKIDGMPRPGLADFTNGMRVFEVEVLDLAIDDENIGQMLKKAQRIVVESNIQIAQAKKSLETTREKERIAQAEDQVKRETEIARIDSGMMIASKRLESDLARIAGQIQSSEKDLLNQQAQEAIQDVEHKANLDRNLARDQQATAMLKEQQEVAWQDLVNHTKAVVERFQAADGKLAEMLVVLQREDIATKLAEAVNIERYLSGDSLGSSLANILTQFPALQGFLTPSEVVVGGDDT